MSFTFGTCRNHFDYVSRYYVLRKQIKRSKYSKEASAGTVVIYSKIGGVGLSCDPKE